MLLSNGSDQSRSTITSTLVSSHTAFSNSQSSGSSSSSNSSDSSDSDDSSDEEDDEALERMKSLLLKAKASARAKEELKKARLEGDSLAGQAEVVLFDAFEEGEGIVGSERKSGSSSKQFVAPSLVRPLSLRTPTSSSMSVTEGGRGIPFTNGKGKEKEVVTRMTLGQDLGDAVEAGGKGDKWGKAPIGTISKKEMKARHPPTAGPQWFNLAAPTMTPELKREIQAMRLRNALDPKRFYKGGAKDDKKLPEFFSMGHILPSTTSASTAAPSIPRKRTFVEELIQDEQAKAYTKRKFVNEVMTKGMSGKARSKKGAKGKKVGRAR